MPDFFDASAYRPADLIFHGRRAGADCMFRRTFGNLIFSDVECRAMADGAGVLAGFACGGLPKPSAAGGVVFIATGPDGLDVRYGDFALDLSVVPIGVAGGDFRLIAPAAREAFRRHKTACVAGLFLDPERLAAVMARHYACQEHDPGLGLSFTRVVRDGFIDAAAFDVVRPRKRAVGLAAATGLFCGRHTDADFPADAVLCDMSAAMDVMSEGATACLKTFCKSLPEDAARFLSVDENIKFWLELFR